MENQFARNPECLFLVTRKDFRKVRTPKIKKVLGSSPIDFGSFSSEAKHNRRTVPRLKWFLLARRLQGQRPQLWKFVPDLSPVEDGFSLEMKHGKRTGPCPMIGL
jgi:hypothetical protein